MSFVRGKRVVKPKRPSKLKLRVLLRRITLKNRHREIDAGGPVGREAW